jgi:predicted RNase H-like nuclease (RuvC/YqgF family)
MTQRDIDELTNLLNEVNTKLILSKDKIDTQERIIKSQEEMIEILKGSVENQDKLINVLKMQIALFEQDMKLKQQEQDNDFLVWDKLFAKLAWKFKPTKSGDMFIDAEAVYEELKNEFNLTFKQD